MTLLTHAPLPSIPCSLETVDLEIRLDLGFKDSIELKAYKKRLTRSWNRLGCPTKIHQLNICPSRFFLVVGSPLHIGRPGRGPEKEKVSLVE